ncbi:MAG: hypothetical protein ACI3VX_06745 [Faecousia sp.]
MKKAVVAHRIAALTFFLALACLLGGCVKKTERLEDLIVGKWRSGHHDSIVIFYEDGTGDDDGDSFTYDISGNMLVMTYDDSTPWSFRVTVESKNHLILEEKTGEQYGYSLEIYRCDASGRIMYGE